MDRLVERLGPLVILWVFAILLLVLLWRIVRMVRRHWVTALCAIGAGGILLALSSLTFAFW